MDKYTILIFFPCFHADRHINHINKDRHKSKKFVYVECDNTQGMKKIANKWEQPNFLKSLSLALDKLGYSNFVVINIENLLALTLQ